LVGLVDLSLHDERFSYTILIPFLSAGVIYLRREHIFRHHRYSPALGIPLVMLGILLWYTLQSPALSLPGTGGLSALTLAVVLVWIALFILCFGVTSFRAAAFPLLFLFLMVPLPVPVLQKTTFALQKGTAGIVDVLFRLAGVPFVRQDFTFSLPGADIQIAEQCSGIRSSLSLLIASILAGHFFIHSAWRKVSLSLLTILIVIFKNAVRIVAISWLGVYVNPDFFYGALHRYGGLPFSLLALGMMGCLLIMLKDRLPSSKRSPDGGLG
jgi:exosortase